MVDLNGNILKRIESPVDASDADWAIAPIDIRFIAEN
jgi:hypothetical protein